MGTYMITGTRHLVVAGLRALFLCPVQTALIALFLTGLVFFPGCGGDDADGPPTIATADIQAVTTASGSAIVTFITGNGDIALKAHVARTPAERSRGLMFVSRLESDEGMIFVWDESTTGGFWMKDTLIPLSIAFIAEDLTIIDIQDMEPQSLEQHSPEAAYRYAIEVNQGYFGENGVAVGDRVELGGGLA